MGNGETSTKISSTEAEQFSDLLNAVLSFLPENRKAAAHLAKNPCFAEPVRLEASGNGNCEKVSYLELESTGSIR